MQKPYRARETKVKKGWHVRAMCECSAWKWEKRRVCNEREPSHVVTTNHMRLSWMRTLLFPPSFTVTLVKNTLRPDGSTRKIGSNLLARGGS
ncbi:hypothetical protein A0H81_01393 [Grifola frondosa]|uniref:Uncharacterized protein n=1 Tax=Grifola frondosa TaxID=5627 RepID=A0A1C7MQW0_GRIFR|nr:hypothetical protein A0H81_01393 [Grifola frondosa]